MPDFTVVTFKMCAYGPQPKIVRIGFFNINLPKTFITWLFVIFFTKFFWEGVPGSHPHVKFHHCGFKNVGLQPPKIAKNGNFWYKFVPNGKYWGSVEKFEYRCTTTNLPVCNDIIIVLLSQTS